MATESGNTRLRANASEWLKRVDDTAAELEGLAAALRNLGEPDVDRTKDVVADAVEAIRGLRGLVPDGGGKGCWTDRTSFETALQQTLQSLEGAEALIRAGLAKLASLIDGGEIVHRVAALRTTLESLRQAAVIELQERSRAPSPQALPGPSAAEDWLDWAWSEKGAPEVDSIERSYPRLFEFVMGADALTFRTAPTQPGTPAMESDSEAPLPPEEARVPDAPQVAEVAVASPVSTVADGLPERPAPAEQHLAPVAALAPVEAIDEVSDRSEDERNEQPYLDEPTAVTELGPSSGDGAAADLDSETVAARPKLRPVEIPTELRSFDPFAAQYWIAADGSCQTVPWNDREAFARALSRGQLTALRERDFPRLAALARAGEHLGLQELISMREIDAVAQLLSSPGNSVAGTSVARTHALTEAAFADWPGAPQGFKLALFLEAVRPSPELFRIAQSLNELLGRANFEDRALHDVVLWLLKSALQSSHVGQGIERLRASIQQAPPVRPEQAEERLAAARKTLQETFTKLFPAAGGKIQRTHCREAWSTFVNRYRELFHRLYPVAKGGIATWNPVKLRAEIAAMPATYTDIFERGAALHVDRQQMDRAALQLVNAVDTVNSAMEAWLEAQQPTPHRPEPPVKKEALDLRRDDASDPAERLCWELLARLLAGLEPNTSAPLALTARHLARYPGLVAYLDGLAEPELRHAPHDTAPLSVTVRAPLHVAALMTDEGASAVGTTGTVLTSLVAEFERRRRGDLLYRLGPLLAPDEEAHLQRERAQEIDRLMAIVSDIDASWQVLDALAAPEAQIVREVVEHARAVVTDEPSSSQQSLLIAAWLERTREVTRHARAQSLGALLEYAKSDAQRARIHDALESGNHLGALMAATEQGRSDVAPSARPSGAPRRCGSTPTRARRSSMLPPKGAPGRSLWSSGCRDSSPRAGTPTASSATSSSRWSAAIRNSAVTPTRGTVKRRPSPSTFAGGWRSAG